MDLAHNIPIEMAANLRLTSCIILYHNVEPLKIVQLFEEFIANGVVKYITDSNEIQLHRLCESLIQFVLRYFIGFRLKEFDVDNGDGLYLITGKEGKRKNKIIAKDTNQSIKQFVEQELLKFEPAIKNIDPANDGRLIIQKINYYRI